MKRILCYGDSNTWGYKPIEGIRYPADVRWTGVLSNELGDEFTILEDGLNGRSTVFDDLYLDYRNGRKGLGYSIITNAPFDMIIISLGTNDLKYTDAIGSSKGIDELLRELENAQGLFPVGLKFKFEKFKVLVVAPITLRPEIATDRPESSVRAMYEESTRFAKYYKQVADARGVFFLDASAYAEASNADCVHMEPDSHKRLGKAIAAKVRDIFSE